MKFRLFAAFAAAAIFVGATFLTPQSFAQRAKPQGGYSQGTVEQLGTMMFMKGYRNESAITRNQLKQMNQANQQKQQLRSVQTKPKK